MGPEKERPKNRKDVTVVKKCLNLLALVLAMALVFTGCSLSDLGLKEEEPQLTGEVGDTFETMFFDFSVDEASSPEEYDGYTPAEGNRLVVCKVTITNTFGEPLPMFDTDFQLQWGSGDEDYAWAVDAFNDSLMPLEWELLTGDTATYEMLFEAPADVDRFMLVYLEMYTDADGNDGEGDLYNVNFSV